MNVFGENHGFLHTLPSAGMVWA